MSTGSPTFVLPYAQQAQIIRAHQRDLFHASSLKEQTEAILRSWLGTRWLSRWDKELDLIVKLLYYGLTTGRASQTLGEEYTDIWQSSSNNSNLPPPLPQRTRYLLLSLLPAYVLGRYGQSQSVAHRYPTLSKWLKEAPSALNVLAEVNLAVFYLSGTYYSLAKRLFGIRYVSTVIENPHAKPPSYSLLGIMIGIRLLYRLHSFIKSTNTTQEVAGHRERRTEKHGHVTDLYVDNRRISSILSEISDEDRPPKPAEEDTGTALQISSVPEDVRSSRNCTLCLEERTDTTATECGHLFCWNCIYGWGREKAECPLCRQSLTLDKLLPIYNL